MHTTNVSLKGGASVNIVMCLHTAYWSFNRM